jgi:regulator of RNase E activity RraA
VTRHNAATDAFNLEETRDFMPHLGPMVGYAITVVCQPSNADHPKNNPRAWTEYRHYVARLPGPKIVVVQDLDRPRVVGAFWGEVNSNIHRALGCVGTICDGAIREVDEMNNAGFKAIARRLAVGHAHSCPVRWNCAVEVFGCKIQPGQLIHADKHGFLAVPFGEEVHLLEAARFMDSNECQTLIPAARGGAGKPLRTICEEFDAAAAEFRKNVKRKSARRGEW